MSVVVILILGTIYTYFANHKAISLLLLSLLGKEIKSTMKLFAVLNPSKILTTEETLTHFKHQRTSFLAGSTTRLKPTKIIAMQSF